jgi:hypothetical protein
MNSATKLELERVERILTEHWALRSEPERQAKLIRKVHEIASAMYFKLSQSGKIAVASANELSMFMAGLSLQDGVAAIGALGHGAEKFRDAVVELLRHLNGSASGRRFKLRSSRLCRRSQTVKPGQEQLDTT